MAAYNLKPNLTNADLNTAANWVEGVKVSAQLTGDTATIPATSTFVVGVIDIVSNLYIYGTSTTGGGVFTNTQILARVTGYSASLTFTGPIGLISGSGFVYTFDGVLTFSSGWTNQGVIYARADTTLMYTDGFNYGVLTIEPGCTATFGGLFQNFFIITCESGSSTLWQGSNVLNWMVIVCYSGSALAFTDGADNNATIIQHRGATVTMDGTFTTPPLFIDSINANDQPLASNVVAGVVYAGGQMTGTAAAGGGGSLFGSASPPASE